jgi:hypothetical protein
VTKRATLNIRSVKEGRIPTTTLVAAVIPTVPTAAVPGASGRTNPAAAAVAASAVTTRTDDPVTAQLAQGLDEMSELAADVQQALDTFEQEGQTVDTPTNPTDTEATDTEASLPDLEEFMAATPITPAIVPTRAPAVPPTPTPPVIPPVTTAHDVAWYADHRGSTKLPIKGDVPPRSWAVRTSVGDMLGPGSDVGAHRSRLDYFLLMFPPLQLNEIVRLTNIHLLKKKKKKLTSIGEVIKMFGVLILSTRYEFGSRSSLWSLNPNSKYVPAPAFGKTGMS